MNKSPITKYIVGAVIVVAFVAYLIFTNNNSTAVTGSPEPITSQPSTSTDTTAAGSGTPTTTTTSTSTGNTGSTDPATSTTVTTGKYKDGSYTSNPVDAFYGNFQITVTVAGGKITDVTFPQAPSGGESSRVSERALPILKQEAIVAQSANVDTVSGATQDSEAFQQSLAAVLTKAQS